MTTQTSVNIYLRSTALHPSQGQLITSKAKRKVGRAGRRSGKTTSAAILSADRFINGQRILYAVPVVDQLTRFWFEIKRALRDLIDKKIVYINETQHIIEIPNTEVRIKAKSAFNADTLRGDYCDVLILDEWQLMDEHAWEYVGAPMLLDNNGDAVFLYTPPSLVSRSMSKARDPLHAAKMFAMAKADTTGRWEAFHFTSHDNPFISKEALAEITLDMTATAINQEIMAEDSDEIPGAPWKQKDIENHRVVEHPDLARIVIGVDPPGGATECGIVAVGRAPNGHLYVLEDVSILTTPEGWAGAVIGLYERLKADRVIGEKNYGGDMVESTIRAAARALHKDVSYKSGTATRGKAVRAEPIVARYERGQVHHVGNFPQLEAEMVQWVPGDTKSPNRMDALVWACTELRTISRNIQGERKESRWGDR